MGRGTPTSPEQARSLYGQEIKNQLSKTRQLAINNTRTPVLALHELLCFIFYSGAWRFITISTAGFSDQPHRQIVHRFSQRSHIIHKTPQANQTPRQAGPYSPSYPRPIAKCIISNVGIRTTLPRVLWAPPYRPSLFAGGEFAKMKMSRHRYGAGLPCESGRANVCCGWVGGRAAGAGPCKSPG